MNVELSVIDAESMGASAGKTASAGSAWSDWIGMVASIGCAIHCAAMPFVIAYLPALGLSFLADEAFHQWMAVACFAIALTAFVPGLRKHGRLTPVIIGSVGLVMISIAAFGFAGECCASCSDHSAQSGLVNADTTGSTSTTQGCTDDCCSLCAADSSAGGETVQADAASISAVSISAASLPSSRDQMLAWIAPWLTPIGGIVLVTAHLLNRRYGCLCGCCKAPTKIGTT